MITDKMAKEWLKQICACLDGTGREDLELKATMLFEIIPIYDLELHICPDCGWIGKTEWGERRCPCCAGAHLERIEDEDGALARIAELFPERIECAHLTFVRDEMECSNCGFTAWYTTEDSYSDGSKYVLTVITDDERFDLALGLYDTKTMTEEPYDRSEFGSVKDFPAAVREMVGMRGYMD